MMHSNSNNRFGPEDSAHDLSSQTTRSAADTLVDRLQRWGIPGFRSGIRWKQWAAAIGYTLIFLVLLGGFAAPDGSLVVVGLLALVWVALVTNAWGVRQKIPVFYSRDKRVVVAGWIVLAVISLIALGTTSQDSERSREQTPHSQTAALPPTAVASVSATATILAMPTQESVTSTGSLPSPRPATPTPMPTAPPSPTPDNRPARLHELVVGSYRGTSKEFLIDGLTPDSFKFDSKRVTVKTDWYPDDEAKEWAVGFCNTIATFRSEFGYTEVQVNGQRDRVLARSEVRGRDRQGNPIIVCRKV